MLNKYNKVQNKSFIEFMSCGFSEEKNEMNKRLLKVLFKLLFIFLFF
jgi:hypothetical protein